MTDGLPEGWTVARLGDLGVWSGGGTPSKSEPAFWTDGTVPWVSPKDMKAFRIRTSEDHITQDAVAKSSAKMIPEASILMVTRSGILAHTFPVAVTQVQVTVNQDIKTLSPFASSPDFIAWYLKSQNFFILKNCTKHGTTVSSVDTDRLKKVEVPLPPLAEQHRIVEKIETLFAQLDKGEEAVRQVQTLLKRYRQSVLKAAVTGELTRGSSKDWKDIPLGELLADIRYGTAKKCSYELADTPVLRIPNVAGGVIDVSDLKYTDLPEKDRKKLALERGDILIVRSNGSANLVGRGAVVDETAEGMAFAGYLIRLRLDRDAVTPEYVQLCLESPFIRASIERQARSTSGVHNINSAEVKAIPIPLPSLEQQMEIVAAADEAYGKTRDLEKWCETELTRSAALRQSILKDAFSGKLVPQDPTDEPASALLDRIRQNRSA